MALSKGHDGSINLRKRRDLEVSNIHCELGAALNCDVTPTDIKALALQFSRGDAALGELRVSGPFDASKMEGRLNVDLTHLDKQLLNLAGAASGLDFGPTTIIATNQIQLSKAEPFNLNTMRGIQPHRDDAGERFEEFDFLPGEIRAA